MGALDLAEGEGELFVGVLLAAGYMMAKTELVTCIRIVKSPLRSQAHI